MDRWSGLGRPTVSMGNSPFPLPIVPRMPARASGAHMVARCRRPARSD